MYSKFERWTFGIDADNLVSLVLEGKKTATTSLYEFDSLSIVGEIYQYLLIQMEVIYAL